MELWKLNVIAVLLVAAFTRKDMAVIAGAFMLIGWVVALSGYPQMKEAAIYCGLNSLLAIIAAGYNKFNHCNLSIFTAFAASIAAVVNMGQMYDLTLISSTMTSVLGWSLVLALVLMDGGKGLLNGFLGDARDSFMRLFHPASHNNNNKGRY